MTRAKLLMQDLINCVLPLDSRVEEIKRSMDELLATITTLHEAGMEVEANILLTALQELRDSLSRIKVSDDGTVVMVH